MRTHSVASGAVVEIVRLVQRWKITESTLLDGLDVPENALDDLTARVPLPRYLAVLGRARSLTGEPGLGFLLGLHTRVSAYGPLGFAAMSAPTVRELIHTIVRFAPLLSTAMGLRLRIEGGLASISVEERADLGDVRDLLVVAWISALWSTALALTGSDFTGCAELGIAEPTYHERFAHLLPPIRYGQTTHRVVIRESLLDVPLLMGDPVALRIAQDHCEEALARLEPGDRLLSAVREHVSQPADRAFTLEEVAAATRTSPGALRRRLARQGTSLSALMQEARRDRALLLLRVPDLSVEAIARRLGYWSEQNFVRAFRRWTGLTPAAYRRSFVRPEDRGTLGSGAA